MRLNKEGWKQEICSILSDHDEFDGYELICDDDRCLPDKLVFYVADFEGDICSELWHAVKQFGTSLDMALKSQSGMSRMQTVTFTVTPPSDSVMHSLAFHMHRQLQILNSKTWNIKFIVFMLVLALLLIGHSCHLLHGHWHNVDRPWEGLLHFAVSHASKFWTWRGDAL